MKMEDLLKDIKNQGYNLKEKIYMYSGGVIGALTPIIAARYFVFGSIKSEGLMGEAIAWTGSIALNMSPMIIKPHMPIPFYTGMGGVILGSLPANVSRMKRIKREKKDLEDKLDDLMKS